MYPELTVKWFKNGNYAQIKYLGTWRPYHNYLWEQASGPIPKGSVIHHKDGDKTHNVLENLECLTRGEHARAHIKGSHWSAEHNAKTSATLIGHSVSDEMRTKMSQSHIGKPMSDETKARMKAAQAARRAREKNL